MRAYRTVIWGLATASFFAGGTGTPDSLRKVAERSGILVGAAVRPEQLSEDEYAKTLASEFNMLEPEDAMKWETVHPTADRFDFSQADRIVEFAISQQMKIRGHTLVWHRQNPKWLMEIGRAHV